MKWKRVISRDANILLKSLVIKGISLGPKYALPQWQGFKNHFWTWHNGETGAHYLIEELNQFTKHFISHALKDDTLPQRYLSKSKAICIAGAEKTKQLSQKIQAKEVSNEELHTLFMQFSDAFSSLAKTVVMTLEGVEKELVPLLQKKMPEKQPSELISILITPSELSIESQEELSRLKIVEEINQHNAYKDLFKKDTLLIKQELNHHSQLKQKIDEHLNNYCWIPLNFEKPLWALDFFIKIIQDNVLNSSHHLTRIKELEEFKQKRDQEKQAYLEILQPNRKEKTIIDLLYVTSNIRLYRASMYSLVYYNAFSVLNEIATRLDSTLDVLKYYTYQEISNALLFNKKLSIEQGKSRVNSFAIFIENNHYQQFEGKEAEEIIHRETPQEKIKLTGEIKGMCAYPGKAKGSVKIISDAREMDKIVRGDILVCKETNPDLVIAMEKAGAIVTDEGGLTSHAAIVSREMKKPCVIGTKIATKILKDNEVVEVDAEKGVVIKL